MITWRLPLAIVVLVAAAAGAAYAVFPRSDTCCPSMPPKAPSSARWVWPNGVPGWQPGSSFTSLTARQVPDGARVLISMGTGRGVTAVLAEDARVGVRLVSGRVVWFSRRALRPSHVLVSVAHVGRQTTIAGVARGDVDRVELTRVSPGVSVLYQRARTWGQFGIGMEVPRDAALLVYAHGHVVERIPLGRGRILR